MIVPPEAAAPPGRVRRTLRAAGLVAPVALLAAVIAGGLLGPRPDPPPPGPTPGAPTPAAADPVAAAPAWVPAGAVPAFPERSAGLPVRSVPAALARLDVDGARPVAVAGWLGELDDPASCPVAEGGDTRGTLSPLCARRARLVVSDPGAANPNAHLHLTIPPGVRLPDAFEARDTAGSAVNAVVLVGRGSPPGADCLESARGCRRQLTVDAVAWADGAPFEPGPISDAGFADTPSNIVYRRLRAATELVTRDDATLLVAAILRPATVAVLDPEARAALERLPAPDGLVWYVRAVAVAPGGDPADPSARIRWAVLDETTGRRLASGVSGDPGRTSLAPVVPTEVLAMPVRDVAALDAAEAGAGAHPVDVVAGHLLAWTDPGLCTRPVPGLPAVGCRRHAVLAAEAWPTNEPDAVEPPGAHLHVIVPPGVVVPESALQVEGADGVPTEVVVLLRGSRASDCPGQDACAPWVVERVAWADGSVLGAGRHVATPLRVGRDDRVGPDPARAVDEAVGPIHLLLRAVLLEPRQLRAVDPVAFRALRRAVAAPGPAGGPVWYLRGLDAGDSERPRIRWAVTTVPDGRVLARGSEPPAR